MSVIDEDSFPALSGKFVSKLRTHIHSASKVWSNDLKLLLAQENSAEVKTYAGRRYFSPPPGISPALQRSSEECYRYLSRNIIVSGPLSAVGGVPHIRASQMALGQLIRSYESTTLYDFSLGAMLFYSPMGNSHCVFFLSLKGTIQHHLWLGHMPDIYA